MINTSTIPNNPGCYQFKDKKKNIIYIGKAKNLKKRVNSYFTKKNHDEKTKLLVNSIKKIDFIVTDNEIEALLLENTLIKKHTPKYNIDLKDSKRYAYLQLTDEKYPRLILVRKKSAKGKFFGPFTSAAERNHIHQLLIRTFKLRTCKRFPKKACLRYHINLCTAPCIKNISEQAYNESIKNTILVLRGHTSNLIKKIKSKMKEASKNQYYESAMNFRDQISALEYLNEKQKIERLKKYDEDIINFEIRDNKVYLILFNIYKGTLTNKQEFAFDWKQNFFEEFLTRFYSDNQVPKEIIVPTKVDLIIQKFLSIKKKSNVRINIPKIGEKKQLLELVKKNIEISFFGDLKKVKELHKKLKLQELPYVIECFDISHLSGTSIVGSMVQFRNGKPDKSNYRRFKIRTVKEIDDYKAIAEVVKRRYTRLKNENQEFPHLVIIDGGKGQLNAALEQLKDLELKIPTISIAKRLEDIYVPGLSKPIRISKREIALKFIQEIRDEAHRFAVKYQRLLRKKEIK